MTTAFTGGGRVFHLQSRSTGDDVAEVTAFPDCDVHLQLFDVRVPARYDGALQLPRMPWAYMCDGCFSELGLGLGLGKGQKLVPPAVRWDVGGFCPLDDTLLQQDSGGWSCPACGAAWDHAGDHGWWLTGGTELAARLQAEDALQAAGLVTGEQRSTCRACRVWVTFGHAEHDERAEHDTSATQPDGGSRRNRRRAAIAAAAVIETALLCQLAGYLTRDRWAHLLPADRVWWWIAGGLVATAAAIGAGWALARWWSGWWPYRHNRLLDTPLPLPDGTGPGAGVRGGGS